MEDQPTGGLMNRRRFLYTSAMGLAALQAGSLLMPRDAAAAIVQPPLPYAQNALEPVISARTLGFHYGKHHAGYVKKTNAALAGSPMAGEPLEKVILQASADPTLIGLFNNAAQVWNHTFYWNSMKPGGGGEPSGELAAKIKVDLGGYQGFVKAFTSAAGSQFGSGWAWLVVLDGKLKVVKSPNAENPLTMHATPLLTIDVWEHAYYLDYQNRRGDYIQAWLDKLVNWDFAAKNLMG